jgi:hypothetical protein
MYILGIDPTKVWPATAAADDPVGFGLGDVGADGNGNIYRFVQADAGGVTAAGYVCVIKPNNSADMVETTNSAPGDSQGRPLGVAMAAIAASGYGWLCIYGSAIPVRVAASCAKGTRLNTTATAGQLDDDATAGAEDAMGLGLDVANGGAAGTVAAAINYPFIGRTI